MMLFPYPVFAIKIVSFLFTQRLYSAYICPFRGVNLSPPHPNGIRPDTCLLNAFKSSSEGIPNRPSILHQSHPAINTSISSSENSSCVPSGSGPSGCSSPIAPDQGRWTPNLGSVRSMTNNIYKLRYSQNEGYAQDIQVIIDATRATGESG